MSLKSELRKILDEQGELSYGRLCEVCAEEGYKVDTGRRRLDDMTDVEGKKCQSKRGTWYIGRWILNKPENPVERQIEAKELNLQPTLYKLDPKHTKTSFAEQLKNS